ncbi:MAG: amino-acid N-acetyltransferase [Planctomycetaceae bacterium]|jgi:amino-acid N-acetyltransferase
MQDKKVTGVELKNGDHITLRAAVAAEQRLIISLVMQNNLNPFGISWQNFIVAADEQNHLVGCGQIKQHNGIEELASLMVIKAWQGTGVSKILMDALLKKANRPLWLMCESPLTSLYKRFGFAEVKEVASLPSLFRNVDSFSRYALGLLFLFRGTYVAFMVLNDDDPLRELAAGRQSVAE